MTGVQTCALPIFACAGYGEHVGGRGCGDVRGCVSAPEEIGSVAHDGGCRALEVEDVADIVEEVHEFPCAGAGVSAEFVAETESAVARAVGSAAELGGWGEDDVLSGARGRAVGLGVPIDGVRVDGGEFGGAVVGKVAGEE